MVSQIASLTNCTLPLSLKPQFHGQISPLDYSDNLLKWTLKLAKISKKTYRENDETFAYKGHFGHFDA